MNICVLLLTWSHQRIILALRQDGNEAETKTRGSSCWTLSVRVDPRIVSGCTENMQQQHEMSTQEFIFKIKFDKDQNNHSKDMQIIFTVLIQKQDGNIFSCNHLEFFFIILVATIRQLVDSMELVFSVMDWAMDFSSSCESFRLQEMAIPV